MTIMNIFLSFGDKMCLMKVHPVPIKIMVVNRTEPLNLVKNNILIKTGYMVLKKTISSKIYSQMNHVIQNSPSCLVFSCFFDLAVINAMK